MYRAYSGRVFRLNASILGIEAVKGQRTAVMVPADEVIRILSGPCPDDRRLVDVLWGQHSLVMFVEDIEARCEEIQSKKTQA